MRVVVNEENYVGFDEMAEEFYRCAQCQYDSLISSFHYCPVCGAELEWRLNPRPS
jgi:rubrerythrin